MTIEKARQSAEIIEELTALVDELKADRDKLQAELTEEKEAHSQTISLYDQMQKEAHQSKRDYFMLKIQHEREWRDIEKRLSEIESRPQTDPAELTALKAENELLKKDNRELQQIIDNELKTLKNSDMDMLEELRTELEASMPELFGDIEQTLTELKQTNEGLKKNNKLLTEKLTSISEDRDALRKLLMSVLRDYEGDLPNYEKELLARLDQKLSVQFKALSRNFTATGM